jgi:hypothetical protein
MYEGVGVLRKFAGSLIGVRVTPQLGTILQAADMIFAWSSAEDLNEWNPETSAGLVTGAGFEQLADIADYLSGLIVSAGTAFIIRSNGISYATATGNAALPFDVNHIGLGDEGEGAQFSSLICQYDNTGAFVGNSNVFQISGSISAIGDKVKAAIFQVLNNNFILPQGSYLSSNAGPVFIGGDTFPLVVFSLGLLSGGVNATLVLYVYNPANGTWMVFTFPATIGSVEPTEIVVNTILVNSLASSNSSASSNVYNQDNLVIGIQQYQELEGLYSPVFYSLQEGVPNSASISRQAGVEFPQEEVLFGRDVTFDALYLSLWANVSEATYVDFYINSVLYATLELDPASWNSLAGNPTEQPLFPVSSYGAGAATGQAPQLTFKVRSLTDTGTAQIRFSKLMLLGSFDPKQRPA